MKRIIIVILLGFLTGSVIVNLTSTVPAKNTTNEKKAGLAKPNSESDIKPPVLPESKAVRFFGFNYTLSGKVKEFNEIGEGYKLVLKTGDAGEISMVTNPKTTIVRKIDSVDTETEFTDLKKGEDVLIAALYDPKNKSWKMNRIIILESLDPSL